MDERGDGQRLDNFVLRECPSVPKTRLYRAMRKGEIRVNKGRARPDQRLAAGDIVRLPPLAAPQPSAPMAAPPGWQERLASSIVHEDRDLLVLNKPSGIAVHGGSGLQFGMIETLRVMRPQDRFLELAHRLDRETSGLVLIARRPAALKRLHGLFRDEGAIDKEYLALVAGRWPRHQRLVEAPLQRVERKSGERFVRVALGGKPSRTAFRVREVFADTTLLQARPLTGRTHQIRVHATHMGHPLLGDSRYSNAESEALTRSLGLRRLFLHAERLRFRLDGTLYDLCAPLDEELSGILRQAAG